MVVTGGAATANLTLQSTAVLEVTEGGRVRVEGGGCVVVEAGALLRLNVTSSATAASVVTVVEAGCVEGNFSRIELSDPCVRGEQQVEDTRISVLVTPDPSCDGSSNSATTTFIIVGAVIGGVALLVGVGMVVLTVLYKVRERAPADRERETADSGEGLQRQRGKAKWFGRLMLRKRGRRPRGEKRKELY